MDVTRRIARRTTRFATVVATASGTFKAPFKKYGSGVSKLSKNSFVKGAQTSKYSCESQWDYLGQLVVWTERMNCSVPLWFRMLHEPLKSNEVHEPFLQLKLPCYVVVSSQRDFMKVNLSLEIKMRIPKWSQQATAWLFAENSRHIIFSLPNPELKSGSMQNISCFEILKPTPRNAQSHYQRVIPVWLLGAIPSIIDNHSNHHSMNCRTCMGILREWRREYHLKTLAKTRTEKSIDGQLNPDVHWKSETKTTCTIYVVCFD